MTPIIDCLKNERFQWTHAATSAFKGVKKLMTETPVMRLLDFSKVFKVACDTSGLAIGRMLSQENYSIAFFNKKLNDAR